MLYLAAYLINGCGGGGAGTRPGKKKPGDEGTGRDKMYENFYQKNPGKFPKREKGYWSPGRIKDYMKEGIYNDKFLSPLFRRWTDASGYILPELLDGLVADGWDMAEITDWIADLGPDAHIGDWIA